MIFHYPEELPVSQRRESILEAIRRHQVVIVCGDTGSGKTTQLPKMMLEVTGEHKGRIGVTQPRRLAATSMARRVAEECKVSFGEAVGVQVRFENRTSPHTRIQFMTDGLLLAQLPSDPDWNAYSALIIDEAHERSLNIDFILGCLKTLLPRRPDLKVVISSATLDAERFSAFFGKAPILQVEGRLYPIDDEFLPMDPDRDLSIQDQVLEALRHLDAKSPGLDTLIFLPGEREIRETADKLGGHYRDRAEVLPLFARLGSRDQQKVFSESSRRRIILATNVAETSLTLPGIRAVIDTGRVRMQRFHPQSRIQRLVTEQISQASSRQRRGRCGRTGPGICVRLYSEDDLNQAPEYTDPEIRRSSLAEVILRMAILGLPPLNDFPLIDPPKGAAISEGYRTLFDIGAMTKSRKLTKLGRLLATFNLEPRLARMLEEANQEHVLPAVLVCAAYCSIQDPRERPADKSEAADQAHAAWKEPASDFLGVLHMWNAVCAASASRSKRNRFCRQHFLHPRRVEEWMNLVDDLRETCRKHRWEVPASIGEMELLDSDSLHRSILAGIPRSIGEKEENQLYRNPGGQQFRIFPGSALAKKPPSWVMTFTLLETSYLFARECAGLNPDWVEEVAPHLCRYQYERPVWNAKRGFVEAEERVQLGQLTLRMGKRVHYGRIDPDASRAIFLQDALVPAKLPIQHPSFARYQQLLASLDVWEHKLRRPGYFTGSHALSHHFEQILPATIFTRKDFEHWCAKNDWVPTLDDLFEGESVREADYPDELHIQKVRVGIEYSFDPGNPERDGITWVANERDLSALPNELLEWTLPAWLPEKVEALIKSLDKKLRVRCMPVNKTAAEAIAWFHQQGFIYTHSLHQALASFLAAKLDCILAAPDLDPARLPGYLRSSLRVIDQEGKGVYSGSTFPGEQQIPKSTGAVKSGGSHPWMQRDCRDWPDPPFPSEIEVDGHTLYPALTDEGTRVSVNLYSHRAEAEAATLEGTLRLYMLTQPDRVRYLQKQLPLPTHTQLDLSMLPSRGADAVSDVLDGILMESLQLHERLPANREEFHRACEHARGILFEVAERKAKELQEIFSLKSKESDVIKTLPDCHIQSDLELQSSTLWAPGWCREPLCLARYPKYLKGRIHRMERCLRDPQKDLAKFRNLEPALDALSTAAPHLPAPLLRQAFLKIEELRLNLFAPELRPHEKMSVQRFAKWLEECQ